jgi:hypothetical protein
VLGQNRGALAGAIGGVTVGRPRCSSKRWILAVALMRAMSLKAPPQDGQVNMSMEKQRRRSSAHGR